MTRNAPVSIVGKNKHSSIVQREKGFIMNHTTTAALVSIVFSLIAIPSSAQPNDHNAHHSKTNKVAQTAESMTNGEIQKVDKDAQKITIRHGAIQNLGMPPMTMVFQVKDPALLNRVKAGDKVRFNVEKIDGAFTITRIKNTK